ncbi:hypothetical protein CLAFUW4_12200 [Fulvia fulva]|nr:uncharacterized protein CLAFUR5_20330 [Fulvia fulva]KAK4618151.1 hypothetical protein CLAFUR4_12205 [Fulvia fulva]KAK4619123.1 hypothetical protein CLAFUR0_12216 [Fulvia fulva]WMI38981.1 hypothetical protein CLAFUR5_20330 [Fulvia fulva]WPV18688.1 hypothetical protein CLAFUW4_12200 [Fulvia fulva]WPV32877.1 hypothetical protein CLAFUW7_12207 [Fulvia fulva]
MLQPPAKPLLPGIAADKSNQPTNQLPLPLPTSTNNI